MKAVAEKSEIDIDAICRLCHEQLVTGKSVNIFGDEKSTSLPINMQIWNFAGFEVSVRLSTPKWQVNNLFCVLFHRKNCLGVVV